MAPCAPAWDLRIPLYMSCIATSLKFTCTIWYFQMQRLLHTHAPHFIHGLWSLERLWLQLNMPCVLHCLICTVSSCKSNLCALIARAQPARESFLRPTFKRAFCKNCSMETARFYIFCTIFFGLSNDIKNVKIGPGGTKCTPPKYDPFYGRVRGGLYQRRPYAGSLHVSPKQSGYL